MLEYGNLNNTQGYSLLKLERKRRRKIEDSKRIINLVLKAVAIAMAIVSIVMGFFPGETTVETHITLLSIGLATLAVAALQKED